MRQVNVHYLNEGDTLAHPVIDASGRILLVAGVKLSNLYIQRLQSLGFNMVFIEDDRLDDVIIHSAITPRTRESAYQTVKSVRSCIESNRLIRTNNMRDLVLRMISDLLSLEGLLGYISDVQGFDDYTFHHSVNTTILALFLGVANKYNETQLLELGMGVLMHDIGKVKIPSETLNKKGSLSTEEFNIIKQHPLDGYEILRQTDDFGLISAHVALQHHERWDGSGYPRGLKGTAIHEYGKIAAIVDVYEALTSKRVYRDAIQPYQAYEYIMAHSKIFFDPTLLNIFSQYIAIYTDGSGVCLSNGERGNVVKQNSGYPGRPNVRMFFQGDERLLSPVNYNLAESPSLLIVETENK